MDSTSNAVDIPVDPSWGGEPQPAIDTPDCDFPLVAQALSSMLALIREQLGMDVIFVSEAMDPRVPQAAQSLRVPRPSLSSSAVMQHIGTQVGAPVVMPDGSVYGTLFAFASRTADLSEREHRRLEVAAHATARLLAQAAGHELAD
ncbi:hypothetical protein [Variovorax sp. KK3]|uniref:hypothetical protein n=1 Tax=Variovorax sp. KK3 TaxID=1855728 RepID=UPI00097BEB18|nr:hypothetical protein [Variovorax sp. KK3]